MATRALVLGAGMVGSVMALDMAADAEFDVTVADVRPPALERVRAKAAAAGRTLRTVEADLSSPQRVTALAREHDVVLGALSSRIGFQTLRAVIDAGRNYCDISFMPEDFAPLDALAKERGVTAVVDCGVAPGMSNILAGYATTLLERTDEIEIYVGGLPVERRWPFEYKAAFSPADVIEEYTRPARLVEHGRVVVREALSEPELMNFPHAGTLEAFNTDGLRSLAINLRVPTMKEKTLRYPGHIEIMRVLRAMGLFSQQPVKVGDVSVRPLDLTSALMFPMWTYEEGEEDLTVMRVRARGIKAGAARTLTWDLFDRYDRATKATSMASTTAFPCTIVARLLASGQIKAPGVIAPEFLGMNEFARAGVVQAVMRGLEARGVRYQFREE